MFVQWAIFLASLLVIRRERGSAPSLASSSQPVSPTPFSFGGPQPPLRADELPLPPEAHAYVFFSSTEFLVPDLCIRWLMQLPSSQPQAQRACACSSLVVLLVALEHVPECWERVLSWNFHVHSLVSCNTNRFLYPRKQVDVVSRGVKGYKRDQKE